MFVFFSISLNAKIFSLISHYLKLGIFASAFKNSFNWLKKLLLLLINKLTSCYSCEHMTHITWYASYSVIPCGTAPSGVNEWSSDAVAVPPRFKDSQMSCQYFEGHIRAYIYILFLSSLIHQRSSLPNTCFKPFIIVSCQKIINK